MPTCAGEEGSILNRSTGVPHRQSETFQGVEEASLDVGIKRGQREKPGDAKDFAQGEGSLTLYDTP